MKLINKLNEIKNECFRLKLEYEHALDDAPDGWDNPESKQETEVNIELLTNLINDCDYYILNFSK